MSCDRLADERQETRIVAFGRDNHSLRRFHDGASLLGDKRCRRPYRSGFTVNLQALTPLSTHTNNEASRALSTIF